jgi:hypothetical protein
VRAGPWVVVSGTAALGPDGAALHPSDCRARTLAALQRAVAATDWRSAADAHREIFAGVNPANTTYFCGGLIPPGALVDEIAPR